MQLSRESKKRQGNLKKLILEVRNIHGVVSELILCMLHKGQEYGLVEVDTEVTNQQPGIVVVSVWKSGPVRFFGQILTDRNRNRLPIMARPQITGPDPK